MKSQFFHRNPHFSHWITIGSPRNPHFFPSPVLHLPGHKSQELHAKRALLRNPKQRRSSCSVSQARAKQPAKRTAATGDSTWDTWWRFLWWLIIIYLFIYIYIYLSLYLSIYLGKWNNISLTWIVRAFGDDSPNPNHDLARYIYICTQL